MAEVKVLISYARADGAPAATRLRAELERTDFIEVWRDVEEMRGGKDWKEQIRAALREVDAMVLLLTPGSVASPVVAWERETALTLSKLVIGLLMQSCSVPSEIASSHYHKMHTPECYGLGFASLMRDLNELATASTRRSGSSENASGVVFHIQNASHSAIGPGATVINNAPSSREKGRTTDEPGEHSGS